MLLSHPRLCNVFSNLLWNPDGRLIFRMLEGEPGLGEYEINLWEIKVDTKTGQAIGKPRQLTSWAGVNFCQLSRTQDGKRLVVSKHISQTDVFVGELEAGGRRLKDVRRLTLNDRNDYPSGWTPETKRSSFGLTVAGRWISTSKGWTSPKSTSGHRTGHKVPPLPECGWLMDSRLVPRDCTSSPPCPELGVGTPVRIMRVPTSGGAPQLVLEGRDITGLACAKGPAANCVFSEPTADNGQLIFSAFDPLTGRGKELTRIKLWQLNPVYSWDLSPDGLRLAFTQSEDGRARIQVLPLAGGEGREIDVKGESGFMDVQWAPRCKGLFVSASQWQRQKVLFVDLQGRANVLWQQWLPGRYSIWSIPSPDGHHLTLLGYTSDNNVWMLENF